MRCAGIGLSRNSADWRGGLEVAGLGLLLLLVGMHIASTTFSPFIYFRF